MQVFYFNHHRCKLYAEVKRPVKNLPLSGKSPAAEVTSTLHQIHQRQFSSELGSSTVRKRLKQKIFVRYVDTETCMLSYEKAHKYTLAEMLHTRGKYQISNLYIFFAAALKGTFHNLSWNDHGILINRNKLSNLSLLDNAAIVENLQELELDILELDHQDPQQRAVKGP